MTPNHDDGGNAGASGLDDTSMNFSSARESGLVPCKTCGLELLPSIRICPNDGTDMLLSGDELFAEKYELLEVIGTGGIGIVYKARHLILDKLVAIKLLCEPTADSNSLIRFQREAKAASSLSHPSVITIFDFGIYQDNQPYMVMDYVEGQTLDEVLKESGPLAIDRMLEIMEPIASAMAHAHKKGILHRDLKPSNIMIVRETDDQDFVKLLDFGLAKLLYGDDQVSLSASGVAMGSPAYMSPEQATGRGVDHRSDIYSMGCLIYEMCTGAPPLVGSSPTETFLNRLNETVPSMSDSCEKDFPPSLEHLVAKMLHKDPNRRFQSAREVHSTIRETKNLRDRANPSATSRDRTGGETSLRTTTSNPKLFAPPGHWRPSVDLPLYDLRPALVEDRLNPSGGGDIAIRSVDWYARQHVILKIAIVLLLVLLMALWAKSML